MLEEKIQNVVTLYKKDDSIKKALEKGASDGNDLCEWAIKGMDSFQLSLINICLKKKLNVNNLDNVKLSYEQMNELLSGMEKGIDVSPWVDETLTPLEIYAAVVNKLTSKNTKKYFLSDYTDDQLYEILTGIENGVDVSQYADVNISADEMMSIRETLEKSPVVTSENSLNKLEAF